MDELPKGRLVEAKTLTIHLVDRDAPTFAFEGEWAGRDIMVVSRTIVRAYRKLQLAARRASSETQTTASATGGK